MEHGDRGRGEGRPRERGHHGVVEHGVAAGGRTASKKAAASRRRPAAVRGDEGGGGDGARVGVRAEESRGVARSGERV